MYGYWSPSCPVRVGDEKNVLITAYVKHDTALIAIASWEKDRVYISLDIDWETLGLDPGNAILEASFIPEFQEASRFKPNELIPVEPGKGWLLILSESQYTLKGSKN
jgi:hypothetical protein